MQKKVPNSYSVSQLLQYYHDEVVPALATAVTLDHKFPQEVLNELRNAMTHMGRANALKPASYEADRELHAAHRHLLRCTLDCLKVVLLVLAKRCDDTIDALNDEMLLPNGVHAEARELRRRRIEINTHEGQQPVDEIVESLKGLCDDYDKFTTRLHDEYSGDAVMRRQSALRRAKWVERGWGFLGGVLASGVVAILLFAFGLG